MSTADERRRSLVETRKFLVDVCWNAQVPDEVREQARYLLKHYPSGYDIVSGRVVDRIIVDEQA